MAVVVAQLVGLKLAQSVRGDRPEPADQADVVLHER
jgi:hypothetical protein